MRRFFTPAAPMKGMIMWHSMGTGKTCAAVATATTTFERQAYTILWVTRAVLKNEIWKNMFNAVCSDVLRERMRKEKDFEIPEDPKQQLKLLSDAWSIKPMSYRQFTNMIAGKNSIYKQLLMKNGRIDPLRKTLLIIDEAHKLYGKEDLQPGERPNMDRVLSVLDNSYEKSGAMSVRLLLMSGTPFANDPMQLIKLVNLCKPAAKRLPTDFDVFARKYLTKEGQFSDRGREKYMDDIAGTVSYLNQERDARRFAQPDIETIRVNLSHSEDLIQKDAEIQEVESHIIVYSEQKQDGIALLQRNLAACGRDEQCKAEYAMQIQNEKFTMQKRLKELKARLRELKAERKKLDANDLSQRNYVLNKCVADTKKRKPRQA
jgi:hypothetical protein